jgi:hypothetical protein
VVDAAGAVGGRPGRDDTAAFPDVQAPAGRPAQDPQDAAVGEPAAAVEG